MKEDNQIAILIPCYNEALSIADVIKDFRKELPYADIYVYDNNSTDNTAQIARDNGAFVKQELRQGKGHVVRAMFKDVEADIYILVDGDGTYPAKYVHSLITPIVKGHADMCVGNRHAEGIYRKNNKRPMHYFGNQLVITLVNLLYKEKLRDIMSGYRAFSKYFVKHIPISSNGFEIETEMTLHALDKKFYISEYPIEYLDRPLGSFSKLHTLKDGFRVLKTIFWIFKDYKPLLFFSLLSLSFFLFSLLVGIPVIYEYSQTTYITKVPSAILAVGLMLISILSLFSGFILDTLTKQHRDNYFLILLRSRDPSSYRDKDNT